LLWHVRIVTEGLAGKVTLLKEARRKKAER